MSGLFSTHLLSLDALLTVVDCIEQHCHSRILKSTTTSHVDQSDKGTDSTGTEGQGAAVGDGEKEETVAQGPPSQMLYQRTGAGQKLVQGKDSATGRDKHCCIYT